MGSARVPLGQQARGAAFGLCAAALFGASSPAAKVLLGAISPVLLAGLLYLGAATGLWLEWLISRPTKEARITRQDRPKLAAMVLAGGVAGPVLMLLGLNRVTALTGSLLLNLEAPLTVVVAVVFFREHLGRDATLATLLILAGAAVLKLEPGVLGADSLGIALLAAACACWAFDNNLTQQLSLRDPFAIVRAKTLAAGAVNTLLGLWVARGALPPLPYVAGALVIGSLSYGISVVLDAYALRLIGASREAAYFATAPFVGAIASVVFLGDSLRRGEILAIAPMIVGVGFMLRERHSHRHGHEEQEHEHWHEHDEHHCHQHESEGPHTHLHRHLAMAHDHQHVPDAHHRHPH